MSHPQGDHRSQRSIDLRISDLQEEQCLNALRHAEQRLSQTEEAEAAQAVELGSRLQELRQRQEHLARFLGCPGYGETWETVEAWGSCGWDHGECHCH